MKGFVKAIRILLGSGCVVLCIGSASTALGAAASAIVAGRITVAGTVPFTKPLPVFKNRSFCGRQVVNETLIVGRDGGVKNAVVILRASKRNERIPSVLAAQALLDNQHCAFVPHVQVVPVGSEVVLKNSDPILHTVHARLGRETLFNVGLPKWRQVTKRLDRAGVVRIDCDVLHTWMSAAIVVSDSPHFAVSDAQGFFRVDGLPAGAYEMAVWHERLGVKTVHLSVTGESVISLDVVYALGDKSR
jgi:plastocyanin